MKVTIFQDVFKKNKNIHVIQLATAWRNPEGKSRTLIEAVRNGSKDFKRNYLSLSQGIWST